MYQYSSSVFSSYKSKASTLDWLKFQARANYTDSQLLHQETVEGKPVKDERLWVYSSGQKVKSEGWATWTNCVILLAIKQSETLQ